VLYNLVGAMSYTLSSRYGLSRSIPDTHQHLQPQDYVGKFPTMSCVLEPFAPLPGEAESRSSSGLSNHISFRPPIMCLQCGAYLNIYAKFENATDRWMCPMCHEINGRFHSVNPLTPPPPNQTKTSILREIYAELQADCHEVREDISVTSPQFAKPMLPKLFIFAIDACLCTDGKANMLLHTFVSSLEPTSRVAVLLFGKAINILRLSSLSCECAVASDVLPGLIDQSSSFQRLFNQQIHVSTAQLVLNDIEALYAGFDCIAACSNSSRIYSDSVKTASAKSHAPVASTAAVCVDVVIAVTNQLTSLHQCGSHLLLVTSSPITLSCTQQPALGEYLPPSRVMGYVALGKRVLSMGCWLDAVHIGSARDKSLEKLDALAGATGGRLITATDSNESSLLFSVGLLIKSQQEKKGRIDSTLLSSNRIFMPAVGSSASVEVLKSPGMLFLMSHADMIISAGLDENHVRHTFDCVNACEMNTHNDLAFFLEAAERSESQNVAFAVERITDYCDESSSGQFCIPRCGPSAKLSVIFGICDEHDLKENFKSSAAGQGQDEEWSAVCLADGAERDGGQDIVGYGYLQMICRYRTKDSKTNVTRVLTVRIPVTSNISVYLGNIQGVAFAETLIRGIVVAYRESCLGTELGHKGGAAAAATAGINSIVYGILIMAVS
jgi:hypothetical protein